MSRMPLRYANVIAILACLGGAIYFWFWPADAALRTIQDLPVCAGSATSSCLEQREGHFDHGLVHDYFVAADGRKYGYHDVSKSWRRHHRWISRQLDGEAVTGFFHDGDLVGFAQHGALGSMHRTSVGYVPPARWVGAAALCLLGAVGFGWFGEVLARRARQAR